MMRYVFLFIVLLLSGCASYEPDKYGNYNDVVLTPNEMTVIAKDIAVFLQRSEGVKTILNINHDDSAFAHTLIHELRVLGIGVSQNNDEYLNLNYRIEQFNTNQFFVTASLNDGRKLSRIWVVKNDFLVPLKTRAYGVEHE
ncbi:hypothetical protein [Vibrio harveyi]|jgi:hypothetical protein|uniref:hypothetical protein n=1 Tax=Vibrio harveyi TaxID=669 RepID=UPI0002F035C0|nr:hypothetical protein [Vibrio harveyi]GBK99876.1 hypothetical protein VH1709_contig00039-0032 [Vibrio harveyi]